MITEKLKETFIKLHQTSKGRSLSEQDEARIAWMFEALAEGDPRARPSRYWEELNRMNVEQLKENGYENFKRTITLNYFTWTRLLPWDSQIRYLAARLPKREVLRCLGAAARARKHDYFSATGAIQSFSYNYLSLLEWAYIDRLGWPESFLELREPEPGNPALVFPRPEMAVSQDLANSLIEFDAYRPALEGIARPTILELGPGYGRNAFVAASLVPGARLVLVDIPPALWVAERYLGEVFPDRRVFRARSFDRYEEIAEEFEAADIAFLLSTQLDKLPPDSADLIVNISSLHEMRKDQIDYYFGLFDHLLKPGGSFYFKQWRVAKVLFEGLTLVEADYPIPAGWEQVFSRTARVQTKFFEALYRKGAGTAAGGV